eukprot:9249768-Pyramimonas_sp.AAC.1
MPSCSAERRPPPAPARPPSDAPCALSARALSGRARWGARLGGGLTTSAGSQYRFTDPHPYVGPVPLQEEYNKFGASSA